MSRALEKIWIGLDWGTHSSKYWYTAQDKSGKRFESIKTEAVVDSTVHRTGDKLRLLRERSRAKSEMQDARLKRLLLNDPQGANYWDAIREGIEISLGDASVLSLAVLLGEVASNLETRNYSISRGETQVEIRYSLPNWISLDVRHQAARRRMFQTAAVVSSLLAAKGFESMPRVADDVKSDSWHGLLVDIRKSDACDRLFRQSPADFRALVETDFSVPNHVDVRWRLGVESSAAGFPQLQHLLIPTEEARKTQDHWVKLLVVDVGAGSTDAGYFISSRKASGRLVLNYLEPAATFDYAGEQLTEMLKNFYLRKKGQDMTIQEAEILKLNSPGEWKEERFLDTWCSQIADYVGEYMFHVRDERRLGETAIPGLKILMTGGSGLVEGLDRAVRNSVVEALVRRHVPGNVANRTEITELTLDWPQDPIDRARRAVSIGAGQHDFAQLKYIESFEKAAPPPGSVESWRG